jgi:hypothetical protein
MHKKNRTRVQKKRTSPPRAGTEKETRGYLLCMVAGKPISVEYFPRVHNVRCLLLLLITAKLTSNVQVRGMRLLQMIALSSRNNIFSQVFWIFMNAQEISSTSSANSPFYLIFFLQPILLVA